MPLFLHGPPGSGKSCLLSALQDQVQSQPRHRFLVRLGPETFDELVRRDSEKLRRSEARDFQPVDVTWQQLIEADYLFFDDVHLLRIRTAAENAEATEALARLLDERFQRDGITVVTGNAPAHELTRLSARARGRLAAGISLALSLPGPASRFVLLKEFCQRRQLAAPATVLEWLAEHLKASVRELESAVGRLQELTRRSPGPLDVAVVARAFELDGTAAPPSIERIVERVGAYFHVDSKQLASRRRFAHFQRARQVGMYLARRCTKLSFSEIGNYFGGRDHSSVLYACRKIERALEREPALGNAVRRLQGQLGDSLCNRC